MSRWYKGRDCGPRSEPANTAKAGERRRDGGPIGGVSSNAANCREIKQRAKGHFSSPLVLSALTLFQSDTILRLKLLGGGHVGLRQIDTA